MQKEKRELRKIKHNIEKVLAGWQLCCCLFDFIFLLFFPFFMTCHGFAGEPKINEVFHPTLAGKKTSTRDSSQAWRKVIDSLISRVNRLWKSQSQVIFHISSVHYHLEWNWMKIAWKSILLPLINAESWREKSAKNFSASEKKNLRIIFLASQRYRYRQRFNEITAAKWWEVRRENQG